MADIQYSDGVYYENGEQICLHKEDEQKIDNFLRDMKRISEEKVNFIRNKATRTTNS